MATFRIVSVGKSNGKCANALGPTILSNSEYMIPATMFAAI